MPYYLGFTSVHISSCVKHFGTSVTNILFLWFVDPIVTVETTAFNIPTIYQPLILQCTTTIVRDINGTVDIIWITGDTPVRRVNNVTASSNINSTSLYNDSFIIPSLNINDIGSVYQCEVLINSIVSTATTTNFIIPIPGTYMYLHIIIMCFHYDVMHTWNVARFEIISKLEIPTYIHISLSYNTLYWLLDILSQTHVCQMHALIWHSLAYLKHSSLLLLMCIGYEQMQVL